MIGLSSRWTPNEGYAGRPPRGRATAHARNRRPLKISSGICGPEGPSIMIGPAGQIDIGR